MSGPVSLAEADALLDDLIPLPPGERRAALAARHDLTPALRAYVERVLEEADRADAFLDPRRVRDGALAADLRAEFEKDEAAVFPPGTRFGGYEIVALAGRGGMGEVYRARDARLGRDVALKVLPADVTGDAARAARLEREARMLASLNHPNIAAIYGVVEEQGRLALVLEYVDGPTLAERLARGPLGLREALPAARQIALALDAAHQRAIVHRDLKPANVKITADGTVKVLDFGLAKTLSPGPAAEAGRGLTTEFRQEGAVLGTPAYMAPEQVLGESASERSDMWAFGCVLYELLTGRRAFGGWSAAESLAHVIEREPDLGALPAGTPEPVRRLLRRLFVKDPRRRLASMADAVLEIEEAEAGRPPAGRPTPRTWAALGIAALLVAVLVIAWRWPAATGPEAGRDGTAPVRLGVPVPASDALLTSAQQVAAISPDGGTIVYRAVRQGRAELFARSLTTLAADPIPGTENGAAPFFSPDGAWLAFDGDGVLRKVSMAGGSPVTICEAPGGASGSWARDTIVFATATTRVLQRVPASGGTPELLTALDARRGDLSHGDPHVMPAADAALFTVATADHKHVASVRFDTREVNVITEGSQPRFVAGGYLVFVRDASLWAAPFSATGLALLGEPRPVLDRLDTTGSGTAHFAVSDTGSLVYVPAREEVRERRLVWADRRGVESPLPLDPAGYQRAALSPDGRRVAVVLSSGDNNDIWIGHVGEASLTRLTREPTSETAPLWSPDGRSIAFRSSREGGGIFRIPVDGSGAITRLTSSGGTFHTPHGWSPDGRTLVFTEFRTYTEQTLAAVDESGAVRRLLPGGRFAQLRPQVSPDGRWLAYQSDESGRFEIYVRPYPSLDAGVWKVSAGGGTSPRWTLHGHELIYYDGRGFIAVRVGPGDDFRAERPQRLFDAAPYQGRLGPDYEVTPDGGRFLMIRSAADTPASRVQLVLVQHWIDELRARLRGD